MTDFTKYANARRRREYTECRANAEQLTRLASGVRAILEASSTPLYECADLDEAYNRLITCALNMAEYR